MNNSIIEIKINRLLTIPMLDEMVSSLTSDINDSICMKDVSVFQIGLKRFSRLKESGTYRVIKSSIYDVLVKAELYSNADYCELEKVILRNLDKYVYK